MKTALFLLTAFAISVAIAFHSPRPSSSTQPRTLATATRLTPEHEKFLADNPWATSPKTDLFPGIVMAEWGFVVVSVCGIALVFIGYLPGQKSDRPARPVRLQ